MVEVIGEDEDADGDTDTDRDRDEGAVRRDLGGFYGGGKI